MKNCKSILCVLAFALAFTVIAATAADAPPLTFTFTKASVPGATATGPVGINNTGMSFGYYTDTAGLNHGYILKGKSVKTLDDPKAKAGTTLGSNIQYNGTAVVGAYTNSAGVSVGFLYKAGTFKDIPGPKGNLGSAANAINDLGDIAGNYTDSGGVVRGYLLKAGKYKTLTVPGASSTVATGVSNNPANAIPPGP